jgi:biopolymer transport protein ExbD
MAMQLGESEGEDAVISQINTTPLVDVMLVLLIIFLITIPAVTTSVKLSLPKERVEVRQTKPENVIVSVDQDGNTFVYDTPVAGVPALAQRLKKIALQTPQPEIQIRGDMNGAYEGVGKVLYACQLAGLVKVSFITEPTANPL